MAPLLLDLHQMVDLALCTPESGVVNTTVLHALLHVIIHKLNVQSNRVEFHGEGGLEIEHSIPTIPIANAVSVTEYSIANPDLLQQRTAISEANTGNVIKTILSVNIPAEHLDENRFPPGFPLVPLKVHTNDAQPFQCEDHSIHDILAVTLPADQDLLRTTQSEPPESLSVMWGMINVSKRVDAVEVGLQRLAELLQKFGKDLHHRIVTSGSRKHKSPLEEKNARKVANGNENEIIPKTRNKKRKPEHLAIDVTNTDNDLTKENTNKKNQIDSKKKQSAVGSKSKSGTNVNVTGLPNSESDMGRVNISDASDTNLHSRNFEEDTENYESDESAIFQSEIHLNQNARIDQHVTAVLNRQLSDLRSAITEEYTTQYSKFNAVFMETMQEVQDMLDAKVDKLCIPPLKQYIANELHGFRKHLEMFAQEFGMIPDAAGTQVIRNVNCISCQRTVNQKDREKQPVPLMDRSRPLKFVQTSNDTDKHRNYGGHNTKTTANERIFRNSNIVTGQSIPQHEYTTKCGTDGKIYQFANAVMCSCNRTNEMT